MNNITKALVCAAAAGAASLASATPEVSDVTFTQDGASRAVLHERHTIPILIAVRSTLLTEREVEHEVDDRPVILDSKLSKHN